MTKQLIIDTCKEYGLPRAEAAYVLATVDWETNHTFEPVAEAYYLKNPTAYRKKLKYWPYYGRGFIQLTWDFNYKKVGEYFHIDLLSKPDLAMEPTLAAKIAVVGMKEGWFTGKDLDDYIDDVDESAKEDFLEWYNARRIVNGMDKANEIAVLAEKYEKELSEAKYGLEATEKPIDGSEQQSSYPSSRTTLLSLLKLLIQFIKGMNKHG